MPTQISLPDVTHDTIDAALAEVRPLLLDEPTNHLALGLVEELEQALADWIGALVVVSHDRLLDRRFTGRRCEIRDGRPVA